MTLQLYHNIIINIYLILTAFREVIFRTNSALDLPHVYHISLRGESQTFDELKNTALAKVKGSPAFIIHVMVIGLSGVQFGL